MLFRLKPLKTLPAALLLILTLFLYIAGCAAEPAPFSSPLSPPLNEDDAAPPEAVKAPHHESEPVPVRVGLYRGVGSWPPNVAATGNFLDHYGYSWTFFDEERVRSGNLADDFDLIWFPGGFAAEYKNLMGGHEEIETFVASGGAFVGVCAGAYYASAVLRWHGTDHPYPLGLFPGTADGPLGSPLVYGEGAEIAPEQALPFAKQFAPVLKMQYMDGPRFLLPRGIKVTVLARYRFSGDPAVIAGRHGDGSYLLFGPHPEMGGRPDQASGYNLEGGDGAQWPWLQAALSWFKSL